MSDSDARPDWIERLRVEHSQQRTQFDLVVKQISELIVEKKRLELSLGAIEQLLALNGVEIDDPLPDETVAGAIEEQIETFNHGNGRVDEIDMRRDYGAFFGIEDDRADLVVKLLREVYPEVLHFREIYARLEKEGQVKPLGKDPANTLLARFSSDERLERVSRGTYRFKQLGVDVGC